MARRYRDVVEEVMVELQRILKFAALLVFFAMPASGQDGLVGLQQVGDWIVYKKNGEPVQCGIMAIPASMNFSRNGKPVKANRGATRVVILYLMNETGQAMLAYESGFPIKQDTTATLEVGGSSFNLYLDPSGESRSWAWPTRSDEARIIEQMRKGNEAIITSVSERGTRVRDVYSLRGVTAGLNAARDECS
ncbi:MAG: hypothetical protein OXC91_04305 [Rhodobacteraceae bacterium]|nr:hypothetical protein [Paracoccaceae bacterium]